MSVVSMPRGTKTPIGATFSTPLPSPTVSNEVETIFIQNSLDEVRKVEEKLRFDIERKKDHLRGIVGERYRDLIDSADLISKLSQTSKQILGEVSLLKTRLGDVSKSLNSDAANDNNSSDSVSIETYRRMLLLLPEQIYNCIDADQPVDAAVLYLLAGDICAHLQLSNSNSIVVATQAQSRLARCRTSLSTACRNRLGALTTPLKHVDSVVSGNNKAVGWLTAFIAIDYLTPLQSYEGFLNCRLEMLKTIVSQNSSPKAVSEALHSYLSTALLTTNLFIDNRGAVFGEIEERVAKICPPALSFEREFVQFTLPQAVSGQLNKLVRHLAQSCHFDGSNNVEGLEPSFVYERLAAWLKSAGHFLALQAPKMLEKIPNLQTLQTVCEDIASVLSACCCQNHVPSVSEIWNGFLAEAIVTRFEVLVRTQMHDVKQELLDLLNSTKEHSLVIWSTTKLSANALVNSTKQGKLEPLQYGRNSSDLFVVGHFAGQQHSAGLQAAISSMDALLAICREFITTGLPLDSREAGLAKMRQEASNFGTSIVDMCRTQLEQEKAASAIAEKFLALSAFSFAMTFLFNYVEDWLSNPNLSVSGKAVFPAKSSSISDPVFWSGCRNHISTLSVDAFYAAVDAFMAKELSESFSKNIESSLNSGGKNSHEMTWLSVEIEEEGDGGQKLKSKISVPQQPSLNVYSFLSSLSRFAAQSPAFLFKQNNLHTVIFNAVARIYNAFISSVKSKESGADAQEFSASAMPQDCAIQHLFDFQLLTALLIGDYRRNQQFASTCIDTIHSLESFIDPFDLNTFQPHLAESVRKYAKNVHSIFGLLLSLETVSYRGGKTAPTTSTQSEDHNVLRLNQNQGRISALSIPFSQAQLYPV